MDTGILGPGSDWDSTGQLCPVFCAVYCGVVQFCNIVLYLLVTLWFILFLSDCGCKCAPEGWLTERHAKPGSR